MSREHERSEGSFARQEAFCSRPKVVFRHGEAHACNFTHRLSGVGSKVCTDGARFTHNG